MHIRLVGTPDECAACAALIANVLDVLGESVPFPIRRPAGLVRVYLTARVLAEVEPSDEQEGQPS
jgi:hypothetical protein